MPPRLGYRLADAVARKLAADPDLPMVQGIRRNQWVIRRGKLDLDQLNASVLAVLQNIACAFYEQFYYLHRPDRLRQQILQNHGISEILTWEKERRGGLVVCGLHMSSFDLVYQAITQMGVKSIGLSLPQESEAIAWQHHLRRKVGGEILPATIPNLKQVIRRLEAGEIVLTGIDRPVAGVKHCPRFFGKPARLPVHYVQLAQAARVPLLLLAPLRRQDGHFEILSSDLITLEEKSDRHSELLENAERVLELAEQMILRAPDQWTMFHPVWPEISITAA